MKARTLTMLIMLITMAFFTGCGGNSDGDGSDYEISRGYLQYRSFPNSDFDHFRAWVELTNNGTPISEGMLDGADVALRGPDDMVMVPASPPFFHENNTLFATWDDFAGAFGETGILSWGGFTFDFSNKIAGDLPAGDYTFEVDVGAGLPLSYTFYYPGFAQAPLVDVGTMSVYDDAVTSIATFTWAEPAGELDQYRIILTNQHGREIFYGRVLAGVSSVEFTPTMKAALDSFAAPLTTLNWQMQARLNTEEGVNYARSKSAFLEVFSE